jgi:hypothetical protein
MDKRSADSAADLIITETVENLKRHTGVDKATLQLMVMAHTSRAYELVAMFTKNTTLALATKIEIVKRLKALPGGYFDDVAKWSGVEDIMNLGKA